MENKNLISLSDRISVLPATQTPFCCDIVFIKEEAVTWIFDVGIGATAIQAINDVKGTKNIVLSHFHPDHITNLPFVSYDELFVSAHTKKYTLKGTVIQEPEAFGNVKILPMPSSHAKGCLALTCGDYAFLGDGAFCKYKGIHHLYNAQLLGDMIQFMQTLDCPFFCLDHEKNFVQNKESVIALYKEIFSRKEPGKAYINVDDYF